MTGKEIKELRYKMGLTQQDFAHKLGTTTQSIHRWEHEKTKPSRLARRLLEQLRTEVERQEVATAKA